MSEDIFLGFSNNLDYEIKWNQLTINELILDFKISSGDLGFPSRIKSVRDILITIANSVRESRGGEFYVENINVIYEFSTFFNFSKTLGGTAIRAGIALNLMQKNSTIYLSSFSELFKELLPITPSYVFEKHDQHVFPHLIIQFPQSASCRLLDREIVSKKPERLIFVHDPINENILINKDLIDLSKQYNSFLISGLNTLKDRDLIHQNLDALEEIFKLLPVETFIFYEHAGYHNDVLATLFQDFLFHKVTFLSMNEDEFFSFVHTYEFLNNPSLLLDLLNQFHKVYPSRFLIIHTSRWSIIFGKEAKQFKSCLQNAINVATARMEFGDNLIYSQYKHIASLLDISEVSLQFCDDFESFQSDSICCLPAFEIRNSSPTTIGLGDSFVAGFLAGLSDLTS